MVDTSFDEGKAEIALQMKLKGLETSSIAEVIGLSVEEIEYL